MENMMKINPMKNFNIIYLLLIIPILYGCTSAEASSGSLPSVTNSSAVIENTEETTSVEDESKTEKEIQDMYSETNSDGIRLELADVSGSDPIYRLAFKKQDTNTGNYLNYADLNAEASDNSDDLENIDIKVEPNCYFGYWLDSEDRLCLSICNIEGNDSIKIMIDGLEYTFSPDREKQEERALNKSIEVKGESVLVEKAVKGIKNENTNVGGILGSRFSTKRKIYELLNHYYEQPLTLFNTQEKKELLKFAIDQIYNNPLLENSKFILGRMMRTGNTHDDIVDTVIEMYENANLCRVDEDKTKHKDPVIICSMGLKA